jgi:Arc/MetJ family transcription regulator
MRTNIDIDDKLMAEARECTGLSTKKAVVEAALRELIRRRAVQELLDLAGKVEFWDNYDPEEGDMEAIDWELP